ncbi:MAG: aminoacyl-tRNA hydrolase [Thermodesulfobacterium geofontis]|uniref:Peptidyl-tRNA hydrolase n=1 Tax=Thermodesulfobacterium geofontis TaxID=1295609 RepID=A0A2N7QFT2_9BACT|nr:MAG: aminoacyl-tRNA hydrolase [Thermodesulfobacterium geofontis]PMP97821.1 MAG: aminoacyl-tRNA hydrolase [Thermodesulfobacterium geofontis]
MWLFCGLGNPGEKYKNTRHNLGFLVIEEFAKKHNLSFKFYKDLESEATFYGDKAILIKPLTYMNLSGRAVKMWIEKEGLSPSNLLVIYDDLDLPLGKIKILPKGGAGGHKGVLSIIETLQTEDFPRLKLGIGKPEKGNARDYVLSSFEEKEWPIVKKVLQRAVTALEEILFEGFNKAMTKVNSWKVNENDP